MQASAALPLQLFKPGLKQPGIEHMIALIGSLEHQLARFRPPGGKQRSTRKQQRDHPVPDTHDNLILRPCRPCFPPAWLNYPNHAAKKQCLLINKFSSENMYSCQEQVKTRPRTTPAAPEIAGRPWPGRRKLRKAGGRHPSGNRRFLSPARHIPPPSITLLNLTNPIQSVSIY